MEKFHKIYDPHLQNPKHKYYVTMAAAASFNSIAAATTSATANSVAAAAAAVSIAIKTAAAAASISNSEQHSCDKWMPIRPQSAGIIRWIGKEKGWSEDKIDSIIKQQVQDELAEGYREHYINIQLADNLKRIVRLSGWSRGKLERKIRQRMRDELAAQQQHQKHGQQHRVAATGVNTIPAGIKNDAKVQGSHPPRFLRKKALSELAESASVAAPETLLKPKPKTKRVRKNPPAPVSFLQKEQQAD
ncbi:hypothetical protein BX661DRAFT_202894 [Kickxella alabastrina]|uniref:uncharacterized protein n=1 Tax=Kickxella alabastrina TaxID=61397 RepID=UPI002220C0DF|nr:uncharacterized protein BX661DRAFT_202894 [Kickxella alabastrina]KAI7835201.1 hypothetical protein BX661DRAFT_202894 [Kickxella alabastrina]